MVADDKVANAEARLQATLNVIPAYTWYAGPSGALTFVNERCADYLGLPKDHPLRFGIDMGAEWDSHLHFVHPDDHDESRRAWSTCLRTGRAGDFSFRVRNAEGGYRWFLSRVEPLRAGDGTVLYWIGVNLDIEELKQAEFYLAEGQRLAHMGSWAFNPAGFEYWSRELFQIHGLDPSGKPPTVEEYMGLVHPADRGFVQQTIQKMLAEHRGFDFTKRIVRPDGNIRYVRCVGSPVTHVGSFEGFVGSGLDVTEQEQLTEELRRSEFYLEEGQRLGHTGSWALNPGGYFEHWSRELFQIYGIDPQKGAPTVEQYLATIHLQDRDFMAETIKRMYEQGSGCDVKKRIIRPDGALRHIRCVSIPVLENGVLKRFLGTAMDVTEQEQLTQELQRREAYLAEAQGLSHTGSFGWKPDSGEIVWSDETYRIFEYGRALKPTIDSIVQRVHPEDRADFLKVIDGASGGETHFEHAYRLLLPDGRVKHVHALAHVEQDASGNREFVGAGIDVTERKRAEQTLRQSEAYLAEAQRLSETGSWAWNPTTDGIRYWSEECYRVLGFDPHGPPPRFETFFQRIHPDDQAASRERFEKAIRDKEDFELDYRLVHPDKGVRDIHVLGHAVLDRSGDLGEFVGTVIDITERKRAEKRLRDQETELRQMLDLAPQLVAVFGPGGERLYANRVALDYVGLSLEEWQQTAGGFSRPGWFIHPDDRERAARAYSDASRSGGSAYELELRVQGADGSYRWFLVRFNPLHDEKGQITRWYVASTDIEDRKRAEEEIREENIALREEIIKASMFEEIVGNSPALQQVLVRVAKVAPTDSTVLVTGETGTGKELIARAIHKASKRSARAFVSVNCAAIPPSLIPSELFGHEKGAFTGAAQRRLGRFELAEGGTIFLDEIGELPPETQVALLRVLQEHEFERVGGNRSIRTNVRVIVATNRDLEAAIAAGTFRSDLFYRLNVFPIEIPPLRQRREDIPMLVQYFIDRYARELGKNIRTVSKETLGLFQSYAWPGNIRELRNVIERSIIICETESFSVDESWLSRQTLPAQPTGKLELRQRLADQEREAIEAALTESRGRVFGPTGAAAKLGIARSTLESKIRTLQIDKNRFRPYSGASSSRIRPETMLVDLQSSY